MSDTSEAIDVTSTEVATVADLTPAIQDRAGALVRPAGTVEEVLEAFTAYTDLCSRILDSSDVQGIQGKSFRKRSAYRKLAAAFAVSYDVRERTVYRDPDTGKVQWAEFVVRATAPGGRYADGFGGCSLDERAFSKPNHDIPATAETRAKNRASADLFGMGEVSAEEVDRKDPATAWATPERYAEVLAAAKRAKADGVDVGAFPILLGVKLVNRTTDPQTGEEYDAIFITETQATELIAALETRRTMAKAERGFGPEGVGGGTSATAGTDAPEGSTDTPAPAAPTPPPTEASGPDDPGPGAGAGDDPTVAAPVVDVEPVPPASPPTAPTPPAEDVGQPAGTPIRKTTTNALGTLGGAIGMTRPTRLKLYGIIAGRPVTTGNDLTDEEGKQAQKAMRLIRDGLIKAAFVDADDNPIDSEDGDLILQPLDRTDGLAPVEDQDGYKFLRALAEQHGLEWIE